MLLKNGLFTNFIIHYVYKLRTHCAHHIWHILLLFLSQSFSYTMHRKPKPIFPSEISPEVFVFATAGSMVFTKSLASYDAEGIL